MVPPLCLIQFAYLLDPQCFVDCVVVQMVLERTLGCESASESN